MNNNYNAISSILKCLQNNPLFDMSHGSKELFHSDFFIYMYRINYDLFISFVNSLLPEGKKIKYRDDYQIAREEKKFDICLYHEEKYGKKQEKTHKIYDLIIENKVKSIPYKEQLEEYRNKIKSGSPSYLLISLVSDFPDRKYIEDENIWTIVNYTNVKKSIETHFVDLNNIRHEIYINDYCELLGLLNELVNKTLEDFEESKIYEYRHLFEQYRLHDLYMKLLNCKFIAYLKKGLKERNINDIYDVNKHREIRQHAKRGIYFNQTINQGEGMIAAWFEKEDGPNKDIYEIVIQGHQYRHGINAERFKDNSAGKIASQNNLYKNFDDSMKAFMNKIPLEGELKPTEIKITKNQDAQKIAAFNGYDYGYIYKYKSITNESVKELIDIMIEDIIANF